MEAGSTVSVEKRKLRPRLGGLGAGAQRVEAAVTQELHGERLDRTMAALWPDMSRTLARKIIGMGAVMVGQKRCRVASRMVRTGDWITATWHAQTLQPESYPLEIKHEDTDLLVVSKPAGQLVQGTELGDTGTLQRELEKRFGDDVRLLHRLDKPASGLMVASRNKSASKGLTPQFREHTIRRVYWAICTGRPEEGPCEIPLQRWKRKMAVAQEGDEAALSAKTDVKVLDTQGEMSLVQATLYTGRTHQIRVHLSALGAPIVGDRLYGGEPASRLCLHAVVLGFTHPVTDEGLDFKQQPGADFWDAGDFPPQGEDG